MKPTPTPASSYGSRRRRAKSVPKSVSAATGPNLVLFECWQCSNNHVQSQNKFDVKNCHALCIVYLFCAVSLVIQRPLAALRCGA